MADDAEKEKDALGESTETSKLESRTKSIEEELREKKDIAVREASEARKRAKEAEKERDVLKKRFDDEEKTKLEQDGKFKELADKAREAADESNRKSKEIEERANQRIIKAELKAAAMAAGIIDLDLLSAISLDGVRMTDDGDVTGVQEAVNKYKEGKPYLFKENSKVAEDKNASLTKQTGGTKSPPSSDAKLNTDSVRGLPKVEREKRLNTYLQGLKGREL